MNAQVETNTVTIEIDGRSLEAPKGSMIIQAADKANIPIPRFCYHPKLAIAANCRMCLVEVEMGGKPMGKPAPACATPVADGMVVRTRSDKALKAQRNVMEFLLINHPLDCPICDQGGECELQDLSLGYGRSISRFTERKRSVADENIGPLIATYMTRCIQCTRCVRVMSEIAGTHELGGMDRGEHLEIGTYIGKSIESELGGNIIDVCPVGALTDKVFQFKARAWELIARKSIGYHDAQGSNLWLHTRRGDILRAVPRDNDDINECWLSDRDRYSHQGLNADDRARRPMLKRDGEWQDVDWQTALDAVVAGLKAAGGQDLGMLVHPASTCEEGLLLKRLAAGLGCSSMDHRLRQLDPAAAAATVFEMPLATVQDAGASLLLGSYPRHEMPLFNHRLRQSVLKGGKVFVANPLAQDFNYPLAGSFIAPPQALLDEMLVLARAASELGDKPQTDSALAEAMASVEVSDAARTAVTALRDADKSLVVFGHLAAMHPQASWLRAAARLIADATGSAVDEIPLGANAIGLSQVGLLPGEGGRDARAMQLEPPKVMILFGAEPPHDFADGSLINDALDKADFVVAFNAFAGEALKNAADVILPIAPLPETPATLVNVDGKAQRVEAAVPATGEVREGWKILRALGRQLGLEGFDLEDMASLDAEVDQALAGTHAIQRTSLAERPGLPSTGLTRMDSIPIYRGDAVLRRAKALNEHPLTRPPEAVMAPADARAMQLEDGQRVRVTGGQVLPLRVDARVPAGAVWIQSTHAATSKLVPMGATLSVDKA
ncbi:MAG: NADH-quinone oxidoreductase subunit NuoG [Rhodanobacteraceae bacterium]